MGAAGRDFHNFNMVFRDNPDYKVVAFTAAQIPGIEGRRYPPELAGRLYPRGIPIKSESELPKLIEKHKVDIVVFSYSDVCNNDVMLKAAQCHAYGADFWLLAPHRTMLSSTKPVISVCAVRTGCGKSQTSRKVATILRDMGYTVAVVRHPMPYGNLKKQRVQHFASIEDLDKYECTIEEREEFRPHLLMGNVVYAGLDYAAILKHAQNEADIILWDGGNNDTPFYKPDIHIVVADPHRAGHELLYYPSAVNVLMADVFVINKQDTASQHQIDAVKANLRMLNPHAYMVDAESPVSVDKPELIRGKRVLVVEDGPTVTHGGMPYGAGLIAAQHYGASRIVDPKPFLTPRLAEVLGQYKHLGRVLPAIGYSEDQLRELEATIRSVECDVVVCATPANLGELLNLSVPCVHVRYDLKVKGTPTLEDIVKKLLKERCGMQGNMQAKS
jgi:predicted GTPase